MVADPRAVRGWNGSIVYQFTFIDVLSIILPIITRVHSLIRQKHLLNYLSGHQRRYLNVQLF